jgi:hypothetical protein
VDCVRGDVVGEREGEFVRDLVEFALEAELPIEMKKGKDRTDQEISICSVVSLLLLVCMTKRL